MIARVEPLVTARSLRGPFDYRLPEAMPDVAVGSVLVVPFGRRRLLAVVVGMEEGSEVAPERLVEPLSALADGVPPELVSLGLWIAEEYCSTPARGLALVLPPGAGRGVRERSALTVARTEAGEAALRDGGSGPRLGARQRAVLEVLAAGPQRVAALVAATGGGHASVRALERRGLVTVARTAQGRRPVLTEVGARGSRPARLTAAQAAALEPIVGALDAPPGADRRLLLHGVTGSGKTEVYLQAVAAALERGRSAIVLVPEIALTPQTAGRFVERFGEAVAVLHSGLRPGERLDEWTRLRRGEASVCIGPRSAVLAPVRDLGLIVVDEEHDGSYKQEADPRYDARHVAERRAAAAGAVLVAGSATPRPEAVHGLRRLSLPERVDGRPLPPVRLVPTPTGPSGLHAETRAALEEVRTRGEKAIVLLNRRGWSNFLACGSCRRVWGCPSCDVALVLHRRTGEVRCHHCGHAEPVPAACPDCGSVSVARHGVGTERLEAELSELCDPLPVVRLDADSARGGRDVGDVLARFEAAPSAVLVGTQAVAKGHDFPDVTLGVVLDADATLRFPDFRAEERAFALVAQLAGRSGRGPRGGRVIVQALDPGARALRHAADHDSDGFLAGELGRREALGYPPFGHLVRVVCSSPAPGPETAAASAVRDRLRVALGSPDRVLGPAPLFRRLGRERSQVVVRAGERARAVRAVGGAVAAVAAERAHREASFAVDVDPL